MVGRKHHQDMDDGMGLGMSHGGGTSSRKHKKRKTTRGDIDVGGEFDWGCFLYKREDAKVGRGSAIVGVMTELL